jgi:ketosteroid isomerase-like protein
LTEPTPTVFTLQANTDAFNRHDLDAIMAFFAPDAVFERDPRSLKHIEMPDESEPHGRGP